MTSQGRIQVAPPFLLPAATAGRRLALPTCPPRPAVPGHPAGSGRVPGALAPSGRDGGRASWPSRTSGGRRALRLLCGCHSRNPSVQSLEAGRLCPAAVNARECAPVSMRVAPAPSAVIAGSLADIVCHWTRSLPSKETPALGELRSPPPSEAERRTRCSASEDRRRWLARSPLLGTHGNVWLHNCEYMYS